MNPYQYVIQKLSLQNRQHSTDDFLSGSLALLSLAQQLDSNGYSGSDPYTKVTNRLLNTYGLPPYIVQKIDRELFASLRSRLQQGIGG